MIAEHPTILPNKNGNLPIAVIAGAGTVDTGAIDPPLIRWTTLPTSASILSSG
jgi:hypothetical protein